MVTGLLSLITTTLTDGRQFAIGKGIERVDRVLRVHPARQAHLDFDLFRRYSREMPAILILFLRAASSMRGDEAFGGGAEGHFADHDPLVVARVKPRAHAHLAVAVVVFRNIKQAAGREVGHTARSVPR